MQGLDLSLIVAMTPKGVIGRNNQLPWRMPSDLNRFRWLTQSMGTVIMGYSTWESILERNGKPLSRRHSIVLTKNHLIEETETVVAMPSIEDVLELIASDPKYQRRACVIGGAQTYAAFIPHVGRIHLTFVNTFLEGDSYFPKGPSLKNWPRIAASATTRWDPDDEYESSFFTLVPPNSRTISPPKIRTAP